MSFSGAVRVCTPSLIVLSLTQASASVIWLTSPNLSFFGLSTYLPFGNLTGRRYLPYHIGVKPRLYRYPCCRKLRGILHLGMFFLRETCPIGSAQLGAVLAARSAGSGPGRCMRSEEH